MSFMMRNDINIALVSMVRQNKTVNNSMLSHLNATDVPIHKTEDVDGGNDVDGEFDWTTLVQSMILSSFYACYVLSQVKNNAFNSNLSVFNCWCFLIPCH